MTSEFVRLTPPESIYAEKNLLYSELEVLNSTKHLLTYKSLKKQENQLKIVLKQEIKVLLDLIKFLDKILPKVKMPESEFAKSPASEALPNSQEEFIEPSELELELQRIKAKLSSLKSR